MNNLEIILNLCHLTMNPIHSLLQRRHSRILGFIPNKPASITAPPNLHHTTTNHQKQITVFTDSNRTNLVKYESTGTPSTVKLLLSTPDTLSRSSICRLILSDTPSTKLFDCRHTNQIKHSEQTNNLQCIRNPQPRHNVTTFLRNFPQYQESQRKHEPAKAANNGLV